MRILKPAAAYVMSLLLILLLSSLSFAAKNPQSEDKKASSGKVVYDSVAAKKYGADAYGMKKYVMAFLKRGPSPVLDPARAKELEAAHLRNIDRLADAGKLVLAGPFFGDGELRGIYIFNVESLEEAEELTKTDPAIQAGSLVLELREWYGSAALMMVNDIHKTLQKMNITEGGEE